MSRRRSLIGNLVVGMAREAARSQRRAIAESRRQQREQIRLARVGARQAAMAAKEAKQQYLADRREEACDLTNEMLERVEELRDLLQNTLATNAETVFGSLRVYPAFPPFLAPPDLMIARAAPTPETFISQVAPLSFFGRLSKKSQKRHEQQLMAARQAFADALDKYHSAEQERMFRLEQARNEHAEAAERHAKEMQQRDEEIVAFWDAYWKRDAAAVGAFAELILARSTFPEGFPDIQRVAYVPESEQLVIECELPPPSIVPTVQEYRYSKTRDLIEEKLRKPADVRQLYQDVIAATALRTLAEIFHADSASAIQVIAFNGYIRTIDPATGRDIQPHLISVRVTRDRFAEIDLQRVDKLVCLRNFGAQVSPRPYEVQPVKPIIDFNMVDKRFIDQTDVLSDLESRPNLMDLTPSEFEQLVANLFDRVGIEAKLTRSHRDGGVDVVGFDKRPVLGGRVVIQAKRYRNTVGVSAVRDLYGTMQHEGANKGILVTTAGYGPDAFSFAADKPIELIDGSGLLYLLEQNGIHARIVFPSDQASA